MGTLTPHITDYLTERRNRGELTIRTVRNMRYCLDGLDINFGRRPLHHLGHRAILRWLESLGHLAPSTRRNHLCTARTFGRWLVDCGLLDDDPTRKVPAIRQPRPMPCTFTPAEVARLYDAAPDQRARAIIALMVGCGLRCVSVSRLQVADYDPETRSLVVSSKGGDEYPVHVPQETYEELGRYLNETGIVAGPLIRSTRVPSSGLSSATISTYVSRIAADAGVKSGPWDGKSAHGLRRTAASDVLETYHDPWAVMEMLGHANLASLKHYGRRAALGRLREVMEGRSYRDAA